MAAKTKEAPTSSLLGAVEQRPKRQVNANFKGREVDPKKVEYLTQLMTEVSEFLAANELPDRAQIPVSDLGGFKPASLAITGNAMVKQQVEAGNEIGFYFVATDHELLVTDEGEEKRGQPTKLIIRIGARPTRQRSKKDETEDASESEASE